MFADTINSNKVCSYECKLVYPSLHDFYYRFFIIVIVALSSINTGLLSRLSLSYFLSVQSVNTEPD